MVGLGLAKSAVLFLPVLRCPFCDVQETGGHDLNIQEIPLAPSPYASDLELCALFETLFERRFLINLFLRGMSMELPAFNQ